MVCDWYKALSEQEKNKKGNGEYDWKIKEYGNKIQTKYAWRRQTKKKKHRKNTEKISTICWNK